MWLLPDAAPNHYFFEAALDVQGGASIVHILPLAQASLSDRLTTAITISLAGDLLQVPLGGTVLAVVDTMAEWLLERQQTRASLSPFTVTWYDTAAQTSVGFLVHANHTAGGGVTLSTQWARTAQETVSRSMTMPVCPLLPTASSGSQDQTTTPSGASADVARRPAWVGRLTDLAGWVRVPLARRSQAEYTGRDKVASIEVVRKRVWARDCG